MFSSVWGDKGIVNIVKNDVLERFYGDTCVTYRVLKENIAKTCKTHFKKHGIWRILWKQMQITVQNIVWTAIGRIPRGGGNRSPGRPGLRMAAKLFEIEMQITCTNV